MMLCGTLITSKTETRHVCNLFVAHCNTSSVLPPSMLTESRPKWFGPTASPTSISNTRSHSPATSISSMIWITNKRATFSLCVKSCVVSVLTLLTMVIFYIHVGACHSFDVHMMTRRGFNQKFAITECCPTCFCEIPSVRSPERGPTQSQKAFWQHCE